MAASVGCGSVPGGWAGFGNQISSTKNVRKKGFRVSCVSSAVDDSFKTLSVHPGASEYEVKKAFTKLALKYHPDVCRESNCGNKFHRIHEAYDLTIKSTRRGLCGRYSFYATWIMKMKAMEEED